MVEALQFSYVDSVFTCNTLFTGNLSFECIIVPLCVGNCMFCVYIVYRPPTCSVVLVTLFSTLCSLDVRHFTNYR